MALLVPVKGPGGFVAESGYRKILGLTIDFANVTADVTALDYRSEEARKVSPHDPVAQRHWNFQALPVPPQQKPEFDPSGSGELIIVKKPAVAGVKDFLSQPIENLLPDVDGSTSLRDLLAAIGYGLAKTCGDNAGAKDV